MMSHERMAGELGLEYYRDQWASSGQRQGKPIKAKQTTKTNKPKTTNKTEPALQRGETGKRANGQTGKRANGQRSSRLSTVKCQLSTANCQQQLPALRTLHTTIGEGQLKGGWEAFKGT